MSALRGTGRFSRIAAVGVMLLAAVALTACGGINMAPGGPSGTGASDAAKALVVPDAVRSQMFQVMKSAGMVVANPAYVFMNYDATSKDRINVTGSFQGPKGLVRGAALVYYTNATLINKSGKWTLTEAR